MYRIALILLSITVFSLPVAPGQAATEWSPLMRAAFYGDLNQVRSLLNAGAPVNVKDDEGSTPLMVAASQGHVAIVRELVARGAEVNVQNNYGWTPLMLATTARRVEVVKLLLARGSDPHIKNRDGKTALTIAQGVGLAALFAPAEPKPQRPPTVQERPPIVQEDRQVAEPERQRVQETPQSRRQDEIRRLLAQAERQLNAVRLTSPTGDNAYESYQKVLELDPDNAEAKAGLERIAAQYEQWAQRRKNEGALDRSLSYIERGLLVQPRHAGLAALQQEVQSQLAVQQHQRAEQESQRFEQESQLAEQESQRREIDRLLAQAKRQLDALRLTLPAGDNAYESYQKLLELDPDNAEVQAGLSRIATEYERMAQQNREQGALKASLSYIERGLEVQPSHEGLLALQEAVQAQLAEQERQLAEQERQRQEIEQLLAQAEQQFNDRRLMQPAGDNAYESYRKVLEIDSNNAEAEAGLARIAGEYERLAGQHKEEDALQESLADIEAGLQVQPAHEGLLALQEAVQAQLAEQERQLAEQERQRQEIEQLLAQAEQQFNDRRLMQPADDNAYESYQKVLEIDPDHAGARAGLEKIVAEYERLAQQHQKEGALQESLATIEDGLQVQPAHEGLLALQEAVQAQLAEQERQRAEQERRQREIGRLLAQAQQQSEAQRLTQPAGDNAHESYQKILELDPDNAKAKAGLVRIAAEYERLARQSQAQGDLQESLAEIERGLEVQAQHEGLLALQEEVQLQLAEQERQRAERERQLAEQERQRQEIERLLAQAERQLKAQRLTQPAGDNAHENYQRVLELDPDNAQARAGLGQIAAEYEQLAGQRQEEGALQESLATIEDGLQVQPSHEGLLALQEAVQAQLAEQEQQRAERERQLAEQERQRQKIERLLAEAEQQFKDRRLMEPEGDNALESYRKVLELDADHAGARAGLEKIVAEYERLAGQHKDKGDLQESLAATEAGLQVQPAHEGLLALQEAVQAQLAERERQRVERERQLAEQERKRQEIERLLAQAERQSKDRRLTQPAGDNAYESYQKVLELEPDNAKAKAGLEKLMAQAQQILREKMSALRQIEQELDAEQQSMRLSIQRALAEEWKPRPGSGAIQ